MSTQADQAALGYIWAWLKAKAADDVVVRDFGAIGNGDGGINCVRVKVRDTILTITPWGEHRHVIGQGVAADISDRPAAVTEQVEEMRQGEEAASGVHPVSRGPQPEADETRPNYGGAERYKCPSCEARQWAWCTTRAGNRSYRPHSAREHMVT